MALAAAQVVDALAAALSAVPAFAGRVYTGRTWPLTETDLPAWRLTAEDEQCDPAALSGVLRHQLTVNVVACARATQDLDDQLHALAAQGLAALFAGNPSNLQLLGIDRFLQDQAEAAIGTLTLRVQATFFVNPAAPETFI